MPLRSYGASYVPIAVVVTASRESLSYTVVVAVLQERIRDTYERAVANIPPVAEKQYWRRYIYLWISYALFEELDARDVERTRQVYR